MRPLQARRTRLAVRAQDYLAEEAAVLLLTFHGTRRRPVHVAGTRPDDDE